MPRGNNPDKNAAMRALGATVIEQGKDFDEAREWVEREAPVRGLRYVHSANEPMLIAGVGPTRWRSSKTFQTPTSFLCRSAAAAAPAGAASSEPVSEGRRAVIGVQAVEADAFTRSWRGPSGSRWIAQGPLQKALRPAIRSI